MFGVLFVSLVKSENEVILSSTLGVGIPVVLVVVTPSNLFTLTGDPTLTHSTREEPSRSFFLAAAAAPTTLPPHLTSPAIPAAIRVPHTVFARMNDRSTAAHLLNKAQIYVLMLLVATAASISTTPNVSSTNHRIAPLMR